MATATANQQTSTLYRSVIEEVIKNVRDAFINEGHDEKVIQELKSAWELRLKDSEAVKMSKNDMPIPDTTAAIYPHNTIQKSLPIAHLPMPSPTGSLVGNFQSGGDHRLREVQSQPMYAMKQHTSLPPNLHSMPHYPGFKQNPVSFVSQHAPMYMGGHSMPQLPPLESSLGSPNDKPSKDQLPGFKYDGKRQQTDLSLIDKMPSAKRSKMAQLDGTGGGGAAATGGADVIEDSTDDDDDDDLDEDDRSDNSEGGAEDTGGGESQGTQGACGGVVDAERDPEIVGDEELGSTDDDETGDDQEDHFETDNMVVCQFKKVTRTRNKWRFHLKDGIMNLNGIDLVFAQATGEADW